MNPELKYQCDACDELHDSEDIAFECCAPDVIEVYLCGHCGDYYEQDKRAAEECCDDVDPDAPPLISKAELEAAGQMRLSV